MSSTLKKCDKHILYSDDVPLWEAIQFDSIICGVEAAKARDPEDLRNMIDHAITTTIVERLTETLCCVASVKQIHFNMDHCIQILGPKYGPDVARKVFEEIQKG